MKSLMLKIVCSIFCVFICLIKVFAAEEAPSKIIEEALSKTATQSYQVEVARPPLYRAGFAKVIIGRKCLPDGKILIRVELFKKTGLAETYWCNEDGIFGRIGQMTAKLGISYNLFAMEDIFLPIPSEEMERSTWEIEEITIHGAPGYQIVQTIDPEFRLAQVPVRYDDEHIKKIAVAKRVFMVGVDNIIYRRQHYNYSGILLAERNLLDAKFNYLFPEEYFASPEHTDLHVLTDSNLNDIYQKEQSMPKVPVRQNVSFDTKRITRWFFRNIGLIALGSAGILLSAWGIHRNKKRKK